MARRIDDVKAKVKKLLELAADQEGKPEADRAMEKAFELMARYGVDERDLTAPNADDEVINRRFDIKGPYGRVQATLLATIARALHCEAIRHVCKRPTVIWVMVFGLRRHVERVEMLYSLLNPRMAILAQKVSSDPVYGSAQQTARLRRSFMNGFIAEMGRRLTVAEEAVTGADERFAVAVINDEDRAKIARNEFYGCGDSGFSSVKSTARFDPDAYGMGALAARSQDIGHDRLPQRPALSG